MASHFKGRLREAYNAMSERVLDVMQGEHGVRQSLEHAVMQAREWVMTVNELTHEEADDLAATLRREVDELSQTLVAAECRWPLPPHLSLQAPPVTVTSEAPASVDEALDRELLADYRDMLGDEALLRMLSLLRQHLPGYLALLGQAWAEADDSALRRAAHTLKGALATVGLKRLRNCAELLQTAPYGPQHSAALTALLQWCGRDLGLLSQQLERAAAPR